MNSLKPGYVKCEKCGIVRNTEEAKDCVVCRTGEPRSLQYQDSVSRAQYADPLLPGITDQQAREYLETVKNIPWGRDPGLIIARTLRIIEMRDIYHMSFPRIGRLLGYKDHSSVWHHYHKYHKKIIK